MNQKLLLLFLWILATANTWAQTGPSTLLPSPRRVAGPMAQPVTGNWSARQAAATTIRYVKAGASGTGSSWSNASGDLQAMIDASASGDQVWISGGIYKPTTAGLSDPRTAAFSLKNGVSVLGGFTGVTGTEGNVGTRTAMPSSTTISGDIGTIDDNSDNSYHVIRNEGNGVTSSAVIDGVTITGGNANSSSSFNGTYGGGMFNNGGSPTINNCLFTQNYGNFGGGLCISYSSVVRVTNCYFLNNSGVIGAFYEAENTNSVVTNCHFEQHKPAPFSYVTSGEMASTLINCTFRDNSTAVYTQAPATANITNGLLWNNGGSSALQGPGITVSYSLLEPGTTNYTDGGNNRMATFSPFENAAGPALKSCAPAIDAGNNAVNTTTTDVLGNTRKVRTIDIGAAEFGGTTTQAATFSDLSQSAAAVCVGQSVTLTATLTGTGPFTLELFRDNVRINGPTTIDVSARIAASPAIGQSGSYQFVATSACNSVTTTYAAITANPLPTRYTVSGGGAFCAGNTAPNVGLTGSQTGVNYQLLRGTTPVGNPVAGTGSALSFGPQATAGTYTVQATNATTSCQQTMTGSVTVTSNPLPTQFALTGGGAYCAGTTPPSVGLAGSQTGVNYQLLRGTTPVASSVAGTGQALSFGAQATAGTYTVLATNATTTCSRTMTGSATVTVNPTPVLTITTPPAVCAPTTVDLTRYVTSDIPATIRFFTDAARTQAVATPAAVATGGTYYVQATTEQGCISNGSIVVTINQPPSTLR